MLRLFSAGGKLIFATVFATLAVAATAADNKASFTERCVMCHQTNGQGLAGQFPRLAGRAAGIAAVPAGRRYLARVVLHGMYGTIEVDGQSITGLMPEFSSVDDAAIAAALNHAISLGKPAKAATPFKPAEIAAVRAEGAVSASENAALRKTLVASGVIK